MRRLYGRRGRFRATNGRVLKRCGAERAAGSNLVRPSSSIGSPQEGGGLTGDLAVSGAMSNAALLRKVLVVAGPNICSCFLQLVNEQTNVIFLGRTGNDAALAAVGLGNMMQNCFGLSVGWGLLGALDTLVSQANGSGDRRLACTYFQRGRILATLQLLWIVPVLLSTAPLLVRLGQDPVVSELAAAYNRTTALALFCFFQFQATAKFLQNMCINTPPMLINLCCSIMHIAWCALFIVRLRLGNTGAGLANAATWTCQWFLISAYLFVAGPRMGFPRRMLLGLQPDAWRGWREYLRVGVPCLMQTSSEWWFWEVCALVVGRLGTVALAAHVAALQFVALSFMPTIGIASAASALVGNALGANDPRGAKRLAAMCTLLNLVVWSVIAACVLAGRSLIAGAYMRPGQVSDLMQSLLVIFAIAGFFDSTQNVMSGVLRGMGKMVITSAVYVFAYYGLMLPTGCAFAFRTTLGVKGLWWAFALGTSIAVFVFSTVLRRADFGSLAERISREMRARTV